MEWTGVYSVVGVYTIQEISQTFSLIIKKKIAEFRNVFDISREQTKCSVILNV